MLISDELQRLKHARERNPDSARSNFRSRYVILTETGHQAGSGEVGGRAEGGDGKGSGAGGRGQGEGSRGRAKGKQCFSGRFFEDCREWRPTTYTSRPVESCRQRKRILGSQHSKEAT